jgi:hypothetical protein
MPQSDETPSQERGTRRRTAKGPEPDTGPTCGQCKHWRAQGDGEGLCYRFPPTVHNDDEGHWLVRPFPPADEVACGEFRGAN